MTKEELINLLAEMPSGTKIYIRQGDDAWPAKATAFKEENVLYLHPAPGDHRNYPKGYAGAVPLPLFELRVKQGDILTRYGKGEWEVMEVQDSYVLLKCLSKPYPGGPQVGKATHIPAVGGCINGTVWSLK